MMLKSPRKIFLGIFLSLGLAACGSTPTAEPVTNTVYVHDEVHLPCGVALTKPAIPDPDAAIRATHEPGELELLMADGRLVRSGWINELEAAVTKCGGSIK